MHFHEDKPQVIQPSTFMSTIKIYVFLLIPLKCEIKIIKKKWQFQIQLGSFHLEIKNNKKIKHNFLVANTLKVS